MITESEMIIKEQFHRIYLNCKKYGNVIKYSQIFGIESKITKYIATELKQYLNTKGITTKCDIQIVTEYPWCTFDYEENNFDSYFNTPIFIKHKQLIDQAIYDGKYYKIIMILHNCYNGWSKEKCFQALNVLLSTNKNQIMNSLRKIFQPVIDDVKSLNEDAIKDFLITSPDDLIKSIEYWEKRKSSFVEGSEERIRIESNIEMANAIFDKKLTLTGVIFDLVEDPERIELKTPNTISESPDKGKVINIDGSSVEDAIVQEGVDDKGAPIWKDNREMTGDAVTKPKFHSKDFVVTLENINDIPAKQQNAKQINVEDFMTMINPEDIQKISTDTLMWVLNKTVSECINNGLNWLLALNLWFNRLASGAITDVKEKLTTDFNYAVQIFFNNVHRKKKLFGKSSAKTEKVVEGLTYSDLRKQAIELQKNNKPWIDEISKILAEGTPNIPPMPQAGIDSLIKGWKEDFDNNKTVVKTESPAPTEEPVVETPVPVSTVISKKDKVIIETKKAIDELKEKEQDNAQQAAFNKYYEGYAMESLATQREGQEEIDTLDGFKELASELYKSNVPEKISDAEYILQIITGARLPKSVVGVTLRNWSPDKLHLFRQWITNAPKEESWSAYQANKEKQLTGADGKKEEVIALIKAGLREKKFKEAADSFTFQKDMLKAAGMKWIPKELYNWYNDVKQEKANPTTIRDEKDIDANIWESFKDIDTLDELGAVASNIVGQGKAQDALLCVLKLIKENKIYDPKNDEVLTDVNRVNWKDEEIHKWFNEYVLPLGTPISESKTEESNETEQTNLPETPVDGVVTEGKSAETTEQSKTEKTVENANKTTSTTEKTEETSIVEDDFLTADEYRDIQNSKNRVGYNNVVSNIFKRVGVDKLAEAQQHIMSATIASKNNYCRKISHNQGHNLPDMMKSVVKNMSYYTEKK